MKKIVKLFKVIFRGDFKAVLGKCKYILNNYGFSGFLTAIRNKMNGRKALFGLEAISGHRLDADEIGNQIIREQQEEYTPQDIQKIIEGFSQQPLISVLMPVYNAPVKWLDKAIASLKKQYYSNWELCVVDDGSSDGRCVDYLLQAAQNDLRIKFVQGKVNRGISYTSNVALNNCSGSFFALLDQDDELTPDALFWVVNTILKHPNVDLIYSDECKIDTSGDYFCTDFYFKPDWSPSLLVNHMYIGHLGTYRTELVRKMGGFRDKYNFSQDYDLALRMADVTNNIQHIERVLYYWRKLPTSGAGGGKDFARVSNMAALTDWFKRNHMDAKMCLNDYANYGSLVLKTNPLVSIIIPTDSYVDLKRCIVSLMRSTYSNIEIIPVTNSKVAAEIEKEFCYLSNLIMCKYDKIFNFSDKCNEGAKLAHGEFVIFFNDDVIPSSPDWIERLLEIQFLPGVGGVSPILLHQDHTIQYAGMTTGTPGLVGTIFNGINYDCAGNSAYNHMLLRDVSVLCGACMLMPKKLFEDIGGFDSINTPSGHSDVDISLKILEKGKRCVCTPYSVLVHIGNHSWDTKAKQTKADIYCLERWGKYIERDPYFTDSMKRMLYLDWAFTFKAYMPEKPLPRGEKSRDILVLSHQLTRTGAPIVLKDLVKVIIENGDFPVVMSPADGPLRRDFLDLGCIVLIDGSMEQGHWIFEHFARNFDLVVANTLGCSRAVEALSGSLPPVIWWIHEGEYAIKHFNSLLPCKIDDNIKIYACANYVKKYLRKTSLQPEEETLEYCVCDSRSEDDKHDNNHDEDLFVMVGSVERRKGQDVLLNAIKKMHKKYRKKAKFVIVGLAMEENLYDEIQQNLMENQNITYCEALPREEIFGLYRKCKCVVVPSRDDPLPVVATEAMMLEKVCICSDHTGTASLIQNKENGLIFPSEDADSLARLLEYVMDNPDEVKAMGKRARKLYEEIFTYQMFKERANRVLRLP